jgi:predicted nucleic acid-binding protein
MVDTTVLLSGIVWPRWPYEVLQHALGGDLRLVLSSTVIEEARRKFSEKFPAYMQDLEDFLGECVYEEAPEPSPEEILTHRDLMRDITDVPIALAAINAGVDYLVSEDKDFTARNETTAKLHEQLNVLLSGTFLRQMMGRTSKELEEIRHREWSDLGES